MRGLLHLLGGSPIPGIVVVLVAITLLTLSEVLAQRFPERGAWLDRGLFRIAIAVGVLAALAIALRFSAVAAGV